MRFLVLIAVVGITLAQEVKEGIDLEKDEFYQALWDRLNKDDNDTIGIEELDMFFRRYDSKDSNPPFLNLYETDWVGGDVRVDEDFEISENHSIVYFKLQDLNDNYDELPDLYERLIDEDIRYIVLSGDFTGDERLNETEFMNAYARVLRGSSFGKMYVDFRPSKGSSLYNDLLDFDSWMAIYYDLDEATESPGDGSMDANDFITAWRARGYGGEEQGRRVFYWLMIESSGILYMEEWALLYVVLDVDGDGLLGIEEILYLDMLIHGDVAREQLKEMGTPKKNN